jgi:hypothetical protein
LVLVVVVMTMGTTLAGSSRRQQIGANINANRAPGYPSGARLSIGRRV